MEKTNDTMTFVTLSKPDVVTIPAADYADLIATQKQYETLVEMLAQSLALNKEKPMVEDVEIPFEMRKTLPLFFKMLEPAAYKWRVEQLKEERTRS